MTGPVGALLCVVTGAAVGLCARESLSSRCRALTDWMSAMHAIRLLISQRRLSMPEVLEGAAMCVRGGRSPVARQLEGMGKSLRERPLCTLPAAYEACRGALLMPPEAEESVRAAFELLGSGSADMRGLAATDCIKRLAPISEKARERMNGMGAVYLRLGLLSGMALGIIIY